MTIVDTTAVLGATPSAERPSLLERHFRAKLMRMYAKTAERQRRAPMALAKADAKRRRKAEQRRAR